MNGGLMAAWRRLREHSWLALAFDVVVILVVFAVVHAWQARNLPLEEPAPTTVLPLLTGGSAGAVVPGKPGIVYFFAPWCRICRMSIGNLDELVANGTLPWGRVIALDYGDTAEVRAFVNQLDLSLPVLMGNRQTAEDWSISAFPTYFVVDGEGRIQSRSVGYSTSLGMRARAWMAM
ncbi:MAG: TlpA disulfide reductase family protein [Lysobacterales bacterium]|jgi:thiol-disulfide isomerase/thioredoxin